MIRAWKIAAILAYIPLCRADEMRLLAGRVLPGGDFIYHAAFSSDGTRLATEFKDAVSIWDTATGDRISTMEVVPGITALAFGPGNRALIAAGKNVLAIVDLRSQSVQRLQGPWGEISAVALSSDNLAWAEGTKVRIWSLSRHEIIREFAGHSSAVRGLAFSPDGLRVVAGESFRIARLWSLRTGCLQQTFPNRSSDLSDIHFSADGRWLLVASSSGIQVAEISSGREFQRYLPDSGFFRTAAFQADGAIVALTTHSRGIPSRESEPDPTFRRLWHSRRLEFLTATHARKPVMYVVAIGVNDYPNPEWRLGFAEQDASEIARFFEANTDVLPYEPETTRIAGSCATGSEIRSVLADVARNATRDDTVLIFMGGHGLLSHDEFFFFPADVPPGSVAVPGATAIGSLELAQALDKIPARRQILILDTCRSGAAVGAISRAVTKSVNGRDFKLLSASAESEEAMEIEKLGHGVLTSVLLDRLVSDVRDHRRETATSLLRHAVDQVPLLAANYNKSSSQKPEFTSIGADFNLVLTPTERHRGPAPASPTPPADAKANDFACELTASDPLYMRPEGVTEQIGDVVLRCSGRPTTTTFDARMTAGAAITNRLLNNGQSDALLILEQPGTRSDPAEALRNGHAFPGKISGNLAQWPLIPVPKDASGYADFQARITGVRMDASQTAGEEHEVYLEARPSPSQLLRATPIVAKLYGRLGYYVEACPGGRPGPPSFDASQGENEDLATGQSSQGRIQYTIRFRESLPDQFLPSERWLNSSRIPGRVLTRADSPDQGTRFVLVLSNVPEGVKVYATKGTLRGESTPGARAQLLMGEATGADQPALQTASGLCGGSSVGMSEIPILGASGISRVGRAVWEVTASDPDSIEEFALGIMVAYAPDAAKNRPALGIVTANLSYAPRTTVTIASATASIPRFLDTSKAADFFRVQPPVTWLLFPGLSNRAGNDSALAFTNRSQAPGSCILQILSEGRQVTALKTPIIGPGEKWGALLGLNRPGGEGCGVAACLFRPAEAEFAVFPANFPLTYSDENKERIRRGELNYDTRKAIVLTGTAPPTAIAADCTTATQ